VANTKLCVYKKCEKCGNQTRATWRYKNYFYCYPCYKKMFNERIKIGVEREKQNEGVKDDGGF